MTDIFKEFKTDMTNIPPIEVIPHENNECKHTDIVSSQSKLFYIKYTPKNIVRQCWYLVQVDLEATLELNKDDSTRNLYHFLLLSKYPNDTNNRVTNLADFGQNGTSIHAVLQQMRLCMVIKY